MIKILMLVVTAGGHQYVTDWGLTADDCAAAKARTISIQTYDPVKQLSIAQRVEYAECVPNEGILGDDD